MREQINIPQLRFSEFNEEWKEKGLGEIAEKKINKNKNNSIKNVFTNSAVQGIVNQRDYFDKDIANQNNLLNYYIIELNDFIYNPRISNYAPVGPISRNHIGIGIMSPLYSVFKIKVGSLDFFEIYFSTSKWYEYMEGIANYGARSDRMNITSHDFYLMPLPFPSIPEQKLIASFFNILNKKIITLQQKKNLLEQYKKGIMQKIFSQEMRFKDHNGRAFPEWNRSKLGALVELEKGEQLNKTELSDIGDYPCINGGISPSGFTHKFNSLKETITISEGGNSCGYINYFTTNFWSGGHCYTMQILDSRILNKQFLFQLLKFNEKKIMKLRVGSGLPNIQKKDIIAFQVFTSNSFEEQTKIASFLSAIDEKINHTQIQIEKMELWKKGLLQKMFV